MKKGKLKVKLRGKEKEKDRKKERKKIKYYNRVQVLWWEGYAAIVRENSMTRALRSSLQKNKEQVPKRP